MAGGQSRRTRVDGEGNGGYHVGHDLVRVRVRVRVRVGVDGDGGLGRR